MTQLNDLKAAVANVQAQLAALAVDEPAAFNRFKQILMEANQTQAIILAAGVVSSPLGPIVLPVTLIPGAFVAASLQVDFVLPPGLSFFSAALGALPASENKSIQTSIMGDVVRVIVFGLNQTAIMEGLDFTLTLTPTIKGSFPIILQNPVASSPQGTALPICVTSGIVTVT